MGVHTAEIFNNIAICCLNTQQFDLIFPCIEKALTLARDAVLADVWYNIGHVGLVVGNLHLSCLCWQLALTYNVTHAEAANNLAAVAMMQGRIDEGKSFFEVSFLL